MNGNTTANFTGQCFIMIVHNDNEPESFRHITAIRHLYVDLSDWFSAQGAILNTNVFKFSSDLIHRLFCGWCSLYSPSRHTTQEWCRYNVKTASFWRNYVKMTSFWRYSDVIITSCVQSELLHRKGTLFFAKLIHVMALRKLGAYGSFLGPQQMCRKISPT